MKSFDLGAVTAYALAVQNGFKGTVEEWLESLRGQGVPVPTPDAAGKVPVVSPDGTDYVFGDGGKQPDWNQNDENQLDYVKNRPFGDFPTGGDTFTVRAGDSLAEYPSVPMGDYAAIRVSDVVPTMEQLNMGAIVTPELDGVSPIQMTSSEVSEGLYSLGNMIMTVAFVATHDNVEWSALGITFPVAGVYLYSQPFAEGITVHFTIPTYTGFPCFKRIDEKYIYGEAVKTYICKDAEVTTVDSGAGYADGRIQLDAISLESDIITVVFDGVEYSNLVGIMSNTYRPTGSAINRFYGNQTVGKNAFEFISEYICDTGEPFGLCFMGSSVVIFTEQTGTHTVSIYVADTADKVPQMYLPRYAGRCVAGEHFEIDGVEEVAACGATVLNSNNKATGPCALAEGSFTVARGQNQHVQGRYNIVDTKGKYVHIVGNGTSDTARSNAHTLDWEGNAWFAGTVEGTAMILTSPNGTRFRVTVADDGTLTAAVTN